jgi:hypothetical protein
MAPQDPKSLRAHRRFQLILWLVMVLAGVLYFVVIILIPADNPSSDPVLDTALLAIATGLVAVLFPVKNRIRGPQEIRNLIRERQAQIVAVVLCDAAPVFGVAMHFVTGSARAQIGTAGLLLHYPKREE